MSYSTCGLGRLITHAPITLHNAPVGQAQKISLELFTTSYDVPPGHVVTLAIDTEGAIYQKPADTNYEIEVPYRSNRQSAIGNRQSAIGNRQSAIGNRC